MGLAQDLGARSINDIFGNKARQRCAQSTGPRPRDRRFPEGVWPLIDCIEKMIDEYPRYAAKQAKRKGSERHGADELFLDGNWSVPDLTPELVHSIKNSVPVLSGGIELQRIAASNHWAEKQQPHKNSLLRKQRSRKKLEQCSRRALAPSKLRGRHRQRLPESLRMLYGAGEDTERRLFETLDRVQRADEYVQSIRFADCDYCKVGWFGTSLPYPGSRSGQPPAYSAVQAGQVALRLKLKFKHGQVAASQKKIIAPFRQGAVPTHNRPPGTGVRGVMCDRKWREIR